MILFILYKKVYCHRICLFSLTQYAKRRPIFYEMLLFFLLEIYLQNILWEKSFLAVLFSMRGHFHLLFY